MLNKAVFLDRDGVINIDKDYVYKIKDLEFIHKAVEGLKILQTKSYKLIIITNQSGIGRNYYSEKEYLNFRRKFNYRLNENGVKIDSEYYCKHAPVENCMCRKPGTLLIEKAIKEHNIDRKNSFFIGDKTSDIFAGEHAGLKTILVLSGKAGKDKKYKVNPDFIVKDLFDASKIIN